MKTSLDKPALAVAELLAFEDCLAQAAMPAHLAATPARKELKLYRTTA
mgnify:CR=1 FL=1